MREKPLILIVDDEENFREIFSAKLGAAGFETATANGETEAVQKSRELKPDLILMDIFMPPGPTGTDVALNIHQNPETKDLKIAFLTNLKDPWPALSGDKASISKELGMEDFIEKTSDLDNIAQKVRDILAGGNQPAAQVAPSQPAPTEQPAPAQPVQPKPVEEAPQQMQPPVQIPTEPAPEAMPPTQEVQPEPPQQPQVPTKPPV